MTANKTQVVSLIWYNSNWCVVALATMLLHRVSVITRHLDKIPSSALLHFFLVSLLMNNS